MINKIKTMILLRKQELNNSIWNIVDVLILPFLMLLVTPYFIEELGTEQYGIWMLVNSIVAGMGVVNLGMGESAIKFISKYRALGDSDNLNRIYSAGFTITLIIFVLIIIIGNAAAIFISEFNIFRLPETDNSLAADTIMIGSVIFGLKQIEQYTVSLFKGYERYDGASVISLISKIILLSSQVASVMLGYNLIGLFTVSAIAMSIVVICEVMIIAFKFKNIRLYPNFKKASIKEIFSFGFWAWIQTLLGIIAGHADRFIVISLAGAKFLAYYSLASTVGAQLHSLFSAGVSWVFPKVSGKSERKEDLTGLYYKLQFLIISAGLIILSILIVLENPIFKTWLGAETYANSILLIKLFLFLAFFNMLSIVPYYFLLGTNLIKISTFFMFLSVMFTLVFMIGGFYITGVTGLVYGKILSSVISIPMMLLYVHFKVIDKYTLKYGIQIYMIVFLFSLSLYLFNVLSFLLIMISISILWLLFKTKILKREKVIEEGDRL